MISHVVKSGAPYVFVVAIADAADVTASGDGSAAYNLSVDANFPLIQSLQPSTTGALATYGGTQPGVVAYNPTGAAVKVVFLKAMGEGGADGAVTPTVKLILNADGTPVLDDTTHLPTVTMGKGVLVAGQVLFVALVPASYG